MHFVSALDKVSGMRTILGLHETVCSGAADGYGRYSSCTCLLSTCSSEFAWQLQKKGKTCAFFVRLLANVDVVGTLLKYLQNAEKASPDFASSRAWSGKCPCQSSQRPQGFYTCLEPSGCDYVKGF